MPNLPRKGKSAFSGKLSRRLVSCTRVGLAGLVMLKSSPDLTEPCATITTTEV